MISISKDISTKLSLQYVEVLVDVAAHSAALGIPFFVVGATARDIVFGAIFGIPAVRATLDIDLALRVEGWEEYFQLRGDLIATKRYRQDSMQLQRMYHTNGSIVDLVPFGPLETPRGTVAWPPDQGILMRTTGFEEALNSSMDVIVAQEPECHIRVCTPAALAVMKIISWHDNYPARRRDAEDLHFLLTEYVNAGNQARLFAADADLFAAADYTYVNAGARMLGRDISAIVGTETRAQLLSILTDETSTESQLRLLSDMTHGRLRDETTSEKALELLEQFRNGLETGHDKHLVGRIA